MSLLEQADRFCQRTGRKRCVHLPEEALDWDERECDLWFYTDGDFHPREPAAGNWQYCRGKESQPGRVSVITVTTGERHRFHELLFWNFQCQVWDDKELIVVETYEDEPSSFLSGKAAWNSNMKVISLQRLPGDDLSIGVKRNIGVHAASGELVAHLDDDDLYAPGYLAFMATRMSHFDGASALKLSSWYVGNAEAGAFGFCDAARLGRKRHMSRKTPAVKMGLYSFGFTLIYNREIALKHPFQDKNLGEDYDWCMELMEHRGSRSIALMPDEFGVCLHVQHGENVSDVDPFVYTDVPLSEIRALRVVDSPGFPSFVKLAELVARVDEARKGGGLPPKLAKEARDAGIISDNDDAEGEIM